MLRVLPGVMAWGLVTGMSRVKGGLPWWVALSMSLTVFAASAQLAAMPLMLLGAPLWVVWLAALCVNLRFVIFSAPMRRHVMVLPRPWRLLIGYLVADITYVMSVSRHGEHEPANVQSPGPLAYLVGLALVNWLAWNLASLVGVCFAEQVPAHWGMGFAGTLALAGLLASLARDRRSVISAALAGTAAVVAFSLPFHLNIVVAVAAAVACGLLLDELAQRKAPAHEGRGA